MPATDQTYYNQKSLHRVFAVASVLLLAATVWVLVVDHRRPWKQIQRTSDRLETQVTRWRQLQALTEDVVSERERLAQSLAEEQSQELPGALLAVLRDEIRQDAARRAEAAPSFDALDEAVEQLTAAAAQAQEARRVWQAARLQADKARLDADDAAARARAAAGSEGESLERGGPVLQAALEQTRRAEAEALAARREAEAAVLPRRQAALAALQGWVDQARFREDTLRRQGRFERAELDAARSAYGLAVSAGRSAATLQQLQTQIDRRQAELDRLTRAGDAAADHRQRLQGMLRQMTDNEQAIRKKLNALEQESRRMDALVAEKRSTYFTFTGYLPRLGKRWLELPFLDALNSPRRIDNLWSDGLDQPCGSFGRVRRFDRCVTCHQGIQKLLGPAPDQPLFAPETTVEFALELPDQTAPTPAGPALPASEPHAAATGQLDSQLEDLCGIRLSSTGLLEPAAPTVMRVVPQSPAANARVWQTGEQTVLGRDLRAQMLQSDPARQPPAGTSCGLLVGDVIVAVDGHPVPQVRDRRAWVAEQCLAAAAARRAALAAGETPRPALRVTVRRGLPHPYAGHPRLDLFVGPNSPHPASRFGCTVCHEGQGSATAFEWASHAPNDPGARRRWQEQYGWFDNPHWDAPMYPRRFAESACLKCHHQVVDLEPSERFPDPPAPKLLAGYRLIRTYGCFGCHEIDGYSSTGRRVAPDLRVEPQDQDSPGTFRKVGPSLRFVGAKLDLPFLFDWIQRPARFQPMARMPQAFGLWQHLPSTDVERQREALAIYSMAVYLQERSQPYDYAQPPAEVTPVATAEQVEARIQRGRIVFQQSGCLVCHSHADFPDVARYRDDDAVELGPDLSNTAAKFAASRHPHGGPWLYSWIRQPTRYDARTVMPDAQLSLVEQRDERGQVVAITDPVADIVAYLMSRPAGDWTPTADAFVQLDESQRVALEQLTLTYLRDDFPEATAQRFLREGIPAAEAQTMKGPERELSVDAPADGGGTPADLVRKRTFYVARKSLLAHGCFACHEIPGLEEAKPIGPSLTGWGRKNTAELAFGHVAQYVRQTAPPADTLPPYFREQLQSHSRIGFIFQKLTEPRSFDFQETHNKKYTARLRMPQFPLNAAEREAVMTVILGLVSDPPTEAFAYQPDTRTAALIRGREVLSKYQCLGCHVLEPETWQVALPPDSYGAQPAQTTYPFVHAPVDEATLAAARQTDRRGLRTAVLRGMPALGHDGRAAIFDPDEFPLEEDEEAPFAPDQLLYGFDLWRPAVLDGWPYQVGEGMLVIPSTQLEQRRRAYGGALTRYLLPHVVERERRENPSAKGSEAWAWLPPPLCGEGGKVQPAWLNDYLLDPHPVRPAALMRMPKYNLSPSEAQVLTDYFAAQDRAAYPYPVATQRRETYLAQASARYAQRLAASSAPDTASLELEASPAGRHLGDAMRIVTSENYCVKCHRVGDFDPGGIDRVKAPDLAAVYQRLRPDYVRAWLAKPNALLPYTGMPINIPYDPAAPFLGAAASQDLYHGTSLEQLDALVDLLLNYDQYARQQARVAPLVEQQKSGAEAAGKRP